MPKTQEPEFRAWRKRYLKRARILCIVGIPIGLFLKLPLVWGLALFGIIVSTIKINLMNRLDE